MSLLGGVKPTYSSAFGHNKNIKSKGFTLAEVLITLGIIGVVAAITMPTLINNYKEKATVNKVKKFYSMISQTYLLSVKDNEHADSWNVGNGYSATTARQLASYLKPYLKIQKDCGTSSGCLGYKSVVKLLKGSNHDTNYDTNSNYYKVILMDGSAMWFRGATTYCKTTDGGISNTCGVFLYDVNGSKEPNTIGIDIFVFLLTPQGIYPSFNNDCNKTSAGWGCSQYIIQKGNMNYLH